MSHFIGYVRSLAIGLVSLALSFTAFAATEPAGPMAGGRSSFGAAPLSDGRALVVGGYGSTGLMYNAEIFDPAAAHDRAHARGDDDIHRHARRATP